MFQRKICPVLDNKRCGIYQCTIEIKDKCFGCEGLGCHYYYYYSQKKKMQVADKREKMSFGMFFEIRGFYQREKRVSTGFILLQ